KAMVKANPDRAQDIIFLAPGTEEPPNIRTSGMGSAYFLDHLPKGVKPTEGIVLDVVGNHVFGQTVFVMGAENSAEQAQQLKRVPAQPGAEVLPLSTPMVEALPYEPWSHFAKSDYDGFRKRDLPFYFLTTGTSDRYHTPNDVPDSIDFAKATNVARYV